MASHRIETYCQTPACVSKARCAHPSEGVERLVRTGRLDPIPYFVATCVATGATSRLAMAGRTTLHWSPVNRWNRLRDHPCLSIRIVTEADRSATRIVLPSEY
jgi:hypothetical protein